jgi:hypothetical protein
LGWVNDVAVEIDRLVVATYNTVSRQLMSAWPFPNAHPGVLQGVGTALLVGPVPVSGLAATYPYLPAPMLDGLVQNNVDEGIVTVADGEMTLTDAARPAAERLRQLFADVPAAMWGPQPQLAALATAAVTQAATREPPVLPSAFAVQVPLVDGSLFRAVNAMRYWRADAHRAAWAAAGLSVQEAHALNVLWDARRGVERVGQGDPRPGRTGVAGLTEKGLAADDAITELGLSLREAIESATDAGTELIYGGFPLAEIDTFLGGLRKLPIS